MTPLDLAEARQLLDAMIAAFAMLGGMIAYYSGFNAARAKKAGVLPSVITEHISEGVAEGFVIGAPLAVIALILVLWT